MIKGVIFDMDGLVLDSESIAEICWKRAMQERGFVISQEDFNKMIGITSVDVEKLLAGVFGPTFDYMQVRNQAVEYTYQYIDEKGVSLKPGLLELLGYLEEKNIPKSIASSTYREFASRKLNAAGIFDRFEHKVFGDEVSSGKPAPDIFLKAAELIQIDPEYCLVLEDSTNGIRGGKAAGMMAIMIPDMLEPCEEMRTLADKIYPSLHEVIEFLKESEV